MSSASTIRGRLEGVKEAQCRRLLGFPAQNGMSGERAAIHKAYRQSLRGSVAARDIVGGETIMIPFRDIVTKRKNFLEDAMGRISIQMAVEDFLRVCKQAFDMLLVPTIAPTRLDNAGKSTAT
jgi:hypothetical protein